MCTPAFRCLSEQAFIQLVGRQIPASGRRSLLNHEQRKILVVDDNVLLAGKLVMIRANFMEV
jgi:hypothetical protein